MSEDEFPLESETALYLFEEQLIDSTGIQPAIARYRGELPPQVCLNSIDTIATALTAWFVPIGSHLMLGSRKTLLNQLTDVKRKDNALILLTNQDPDADAQGYTIVPHKLWFVYGPIPEASCLVIDNIPPPKSNPFDRHSDSYRHGTVYIHDDEKHGWELLTAQRGHNPLLIFPYGSCYAKKHARTLVIDEICKNDFSLLDKHNR